MGTLHPSVVSCRRLPYNYQRCGIGILRSRLRECLRTRDVAAGRCVYDQIIKGALESDAVLGSLLIRLFSLCGLLSDANQLFKEIWRPTVHAWGAIISANSKHGQNENAIKLYSIMIACAGQGDVWCHDQCVHSTWALSRCRYSVPENVAEGNRIRSVNFNMELDGSVGNALVASYIKCGSIEDAHKVFCGLESKKK